MDLTPVVPHPRDDKDKEIVRHRSSKSLDDLRKRGIYVQAVTACLGVLLAVFAAEAPLNDNMSLVLRCGVSLLTIILITSICSVHMLMARIHSWSRIPRIPLFSEILLCIPHSFPFILPHPHDSVTAALLHAGTCLRLLLIAHALWSMSYLSSTSVSVLSAFLHIRTDSNGFVLRSLATMFRVAFIVSVYISILACASYSASVVRIASRTSDSSFETSTYLLLVSVTAVGYGDVSPVHDSSRFVVLVSILTALVLLGVSVNVLIRTSTLKEEEKIILHSLASQKTRAASMQAAAMAIQGHWRKNRKQLRVLRRWKMLRMNVIQDSSEEVDGQGSVLYRAHEWIHKVTNTKGTENQTPEKAVEGICTALRHSVQEVQRKWTELEDEIMSRYTV